jgi:hypothetical protein
MKLSIEFDNDGAVYELMDVIVTAHLRSTRDDMTMWQSNPKHVDDVESDKKVMAALEVLIEYFGGKS